MADLVITIPGSQPQSRKRVSDAVVTASYVVHGNIWKVAEEVGLCGQSVHERLVKLGLQRPMNTFSEEEKDRLRAEYALAADAGKLTELALDMSRTKQFICRQARLLGLTDKTRTRVYNATWKYAAHDYAAPIWDAFKLSRLGLRAFCETKGYDDLGFSACMQRYFLDEYEHVIELKLGRNKLYVKGRRLEYRVRDAMKALGYFSMRSPGSKSPVDVLAIKSGIVLMIQCKKGGVLPTKEWNALFDLAAEQGALPVLASTANNSVLSYHRLIDRKYGARRRQPMELFKP